jgi:hypothetical protein
MEPQRRGAHMRSLCADLVRPEIVFYGVSEWATTGRRSKTRRGMPDVMFITKRAESGSPSLPMWGPIVSQEAVPVRV